MTHEESEEDKNGNDTSKDDAIIAEISKKVTLLLGFKLFMQQFRGAFIKCYLHAIRNWKIILLQLLTPAIMTTLAVIQILTIPEIGAQPELSLSLGPYKTMNKQDIKTPYNFANQSFGLELKDIIEGTSKPESMASNFSTWLPEQKEKDLTYFDRVYVLAFQGTANFVFTWESDFFQKISRKSV